MNLPWTNTHTPMFTLSSIATAAKCLGPTEIYAAAFLAKAYRTFQTDKGASLHSYLTEGLGMRIRFYCCSY